MLNNMHNLTKIDRLKGEQGIFSDYPHHYKMKFEGKAEVVLHGVRNAENSEFLVSCIAVSHLELKGFTGRFHTIWQRLHGNYHA